MVVFVPASTKEKVNSRKGTIGSPGMEPENVEYVMDTVSSLI